MARTHFSGPVDSAGGFEVNGVTVIDENGNIDAPVTTTDLTTTGNTTLGNATSDLLTVAGQSLHRGIVFQAQGAPTAKTVSATLTAAEIAAQIITVNQGAGASSALQLPLASAMDTQFANAAAGDSFDFFVINTSTVDAEDASLTTNTGWTLVGKMDVLANNAAGTANTSGHFRALKTGTAAWTLYRLA